MGILSFNDSAMINYRNKSESKKFSSIVILSEMMQGDNMWEISTKNYNDNLCVY